MADAGIRILLDDREVFLRELDSNVKYTADVDNGRGSQHFLPAMSPAEIRSYLSRVECSYGTMIVKPYQEK